MTSDELDLDWRSIEILQALTQADGPLETSTIRDSTAVEDNRRILYRVTEHLEPAGLVTTTQPDRAGTTIPPKKVTLTETGREATQSIQNNRDGDSTLEDLPGLVDQLQAEVDALTEKAETLEEQLTHVDEQLAQRRETDAAVSNALTNLDERLTALEEDRK
jgi:chromosome segregation ATPase